MPKLIAALTLERRALNTASTGEEFSLIASSDDGTTIADVRLIAGPASAAQFISVIQLTAKSVSPYLKKSGLQKIAKGLLSDPFPKGPTAITAYGKSYEMAPIMGNMMMSIRSADD